MPEAMLRSMGRRKEATTVGYNRSYMRILILKSLLPMQGRAQMDHISSTEYALGYILALYISCILVDPEYRISRFQDDTLNSILFGAPLLASILPL